jgi:predicted nuclease of restriction endonuclease-like (RecB) superfamily
MDFPQLTSNILVTHNVLQSNAMRAINQNITARNWLVGYWIVEFEQNGEDRAKYGDRLLSELAKSVDIKGLGATMLSQCRKFYLVYPQIGKEIDLFLRRPQNQQIFQTLTEKLQISENHTDIIFQTLSEKSHGELMVITQDRERPIPRVGTEKIFSNLSFSHIIEILSIDDPLKRSFYEIETIKGCWSVRELRRQIDTLCYERAGISKNPEKLMTLVNEKAEVSMPSTIVKSPYVFDFWGLKSADVVEESDLETLLISHIQEFILELGEGFCFEGRQKRILIDDEYFFVDLVFYHRILKCHVLVELKTRKFNYADMAQLNMYVAYYRDKMMTEGDNAPIGILLCTDATSEMVKFATAGMDENLFVSKYLLQLPAKEKFVEFLNNELKQL